VLDEAWTGLDEAARAELASVVRERARSGACVVFVDHDPARLEDATDEAWVVRDGSVVAAEMPMPPPLSAIGVRMAIEVTGVPSADSLTALLPEAEISAGRAGPQRIVVAEELSDEVLRRLLALSPEIHISAVTVLRVSAEY
jgi:ABC-type multidrug transport system ATPase subunit